MTYGQESIERPSAPVEADERELDSLLDILLTRRGFDFSGYKRASLMRRILRRMSSVGAESLADYRVYLEASSDEVGELLTVLLINVTAFFRDRPAWDALAARLPNIIDLRTEAPIRIWSAGCSSGEEPYSLAMLLREMLGKDAFARRVKIYATDIDDDALAIAREATYTSQTLEDVPPHLVARYFSPSGDRFTLSKELRQDVIFGRHDLLHDAPIPQVDVLVCRNALMYFTPATQERVLENLRFALKPSGVLFLGKAEMLLSHSHLFSPLDLKLRLFTPAVSPTRSSFAARNTPEIDLSAKEDSLEPTGVRLRKVAIDVGPVAQVVIDSGGRLASANRRAAQLFALGPHDTGALVAELSFAARSPELRSCIERAWVERRVTRLNEVELAHATGEHTFLDVEATPVLSDSGSLLGVQVTCVDATQAHRLRLALRQSTVELEAAREELRAARQELQTTNDVLQSTSEELETTNEELQSTNEELESMNEELQSTNEELQTINEELRQRGTELGATTALFGAVLASLRTGVVIVDHELRVQAWNAMMTEYSGVRAHEAIGREFSTLALGFERRLPLGDIATMLRAALERQEESRRTIENRSSKKVACELRVAPLLGVHGSGVIVLVGEVD